MHASRTDLPPNPDVTLPEGKLEARATDFVVRLAFLGLFAYWSLELVRPFLPVVVWAILLTVALYPAFAWLAGRLGGRRGLAALIVTLIALATILGPVSVLAASLAESLQWLAAGIDAGTLRVPPPPPALDEWPLVGKPLDEAWALASSNLDGAIARYGPSILPAGGGVLRHIAALGADLLKFVLSIVIAGFLFAPGPKLAAGARVLGMPWTAARRRQLLASRVDTTLAVVQLMRRLQKAPRVLVSASAVGFYGASPNASIEPLDETAPPRPGEFQSDLCAAIEHEARRAEIGTIKPRMAKHHRRTGGERDNLGLGVGKAEGFSLRRRMGKGADDTILLLEEFVPALAPVEIEDWFDHAAGHQSGGRSQVAQPRPGGRLAPQVGEGRPPRGHP